MYSVLVIVQVVIAIAIIGLVLLQQGKGADMGAAFGAGASGTVFGAHGSANFLSRTTAVLAALFFIVSLTLAYLANQGSTAIDSVMNTSPLAEQPAGKAAVKPAADSDSKTADQPARAAKIPEGTAVPVQGGQADNADAAAEPAEKAQGKPAAPVKAPE